MMNRAAAALLLFALTACDDGAFTTPTTNDLVSPAANYELDTWGANSEIYEFSPKLAPEKHCIVFLTDSINAATMQCFDKAAATPTVPLAK